MRITPQCEGGRHAECDGIGRDGLWCECDHHHADLTALRPAEIVATIGPRDAARLAREILAIVLAGGVTYADFQSAQSAERGIRRAVRALELI